MYQANVVNVMIASPSDVAAERQAIQAIIHGWNSVHAEDRKTVLMPIMWETHSTPEMGDRAQAIINRQVLERCDLLVAVFWTRLGSPTGDSPSGTVEEIRKHLAAGRPALIYFSKQPVDPESIDAKQYDALKAFRAECEKNGLIAKYDSLQEFGNMFSRHLAQIVRDRFPNADVMGNVDAVAPIQPPVPQLSEEAKRLLVAAADGHGDVMCLGTLSGTIIQAGGHSMAKQGDRRDEARWKAAITELVNEGLLEPRGYKGEVFAVTHAGYQLAELLKPQMQSPS